ncbi:hypothetical protein NO268_08720, partial [Campylobacter jejuni]|nr:hypothetical protein [Campylobacter jejuni]
MEKETKHSKDKKEALKEAKAPKVYQTGTENKKTTVKKNLRKKKKIKYVEHTRSSNLIFSNRELGWLNFNLRVLAEVE